MMEAKLSVTDAVITDRRSSVNRELSFAHVAVQGQNFLRILSTSVDSSVRRPCSATTGVCCV